MGKKITPTSPKNLDYNGKCNKVYTDITDFGRFKVTRKLGPVSQYFQVFVKTDLSASPSAQAVQVFVLILRAFCHRSLLLFLTLFFLVVQYSGQT